MKQLLSVFIILSIALTSFGQAKTRGKVKRKYRDVEQSSPQLPRIFLRGEVYDSDRIPVAGAHVTVDGTIKGVNTNENGEFLIENLTTGNARIRISMMGFATKTTDLEMRVGENYKDIMLMKVNINLEPVTVIAQKHEQQILDVPAAISVVSSKTIERLNITELRQLGDLVAGFYIREQGANRPGFVIRGLSSEEVSASAQPRVSVYSNNVPINRTSGASPELFDMERVEVLKGPQNILFGRGAQTGAVHFISKMPRNNTEGYITAGVGEYNQKELQSAFNLPLIEDKLFIRASGIYIDREGYIENTFGGTLNGKNSIAGRVSTRFLPARDHKIDLVLNYQKDKTPGIAFMSKMFPNTNQETGVFSRVASLEQGKNLGTGIEFYDATLNYKFYIDEHTSWTSITSYRKGSSNARWDGDGTASAAIDMAEKAGTSQFYQEIRGNFSQNSRMIGSIGASYWHEMADQSYWFSPNEQHFASLMLTQPPTPVYASGQPVVIPSIPNIPQMGPLAGMPLPGNHQEETRNAATNQAAEVFLDFTYQLKHKIFISGGIRGVYDRYKLNGDAEFSGGDPSVLGMFTGNMPNLFFKPYTLREISKNTISVTGKAGIKYRFNEYGNLFVNYSRGRRPNVLQFTSTGEKQVLDAEILNNFDAGFKATFFERVFVDAIGFFQKYKNFQIEEWVAVPEKGEFNYVVIDGGKATNYGFETSMNVAVAKQLELFGNYAWLHAIFDSTNTSGQKQKFAGNSFILAPEHSFTTGINAQFSLTKNTQFFISPSYSYKTHVWFTYSNTPGIDQDAFGLLNINGGLRFSEPKLTLSAFATNLLDQNYVTSGGNTGSLFGIPTFVPGAPRMAGTKLTWNF